MSRPKISVIVPVYNVEEYIKETLDSLLSQSMIDDIEVILVDDGSTDESRYITERYALDYDNFHAYHKENEGQGIARNYGLKLAKGDYIHFLDSDDYIPPDAYETLYNLAVESDSDIVIGDALRFARYQVWQEDFLKNVFDSMDEDIITTTFDEYPSLVWNTVIWNNLYRREFLQKNGIRFLDEKIFFEDLLFTIETYISAESITLSKDLVYCWRLRNNQSSVTQQESDVINLKNRLKILRLVNERLHEHDINPEIIRQEYMKWINHDFKFYLKRFDRFPNDYQGELFDEIREMLKLIPDDLIEGLNSYKKVLYRMILDNDFDSFLAFAPLENELYATPEIPEFLSDEYKSFFDFKKAVKDEQLEGEITDVAFDDSNLYIDFEAGINYLTDEEYEIMANIVDPNGKSALEVRDASCIIIPLSQIRGRDMLKISVSYNFNDFTKENFLKIRHRKSLEFKDHYVDLDMGINSHLYINSRIKSSNSIEISDIEFDEENFIFRAKSENKITQIYLENIIDFKKIIYPARYEGNSFTFQIPYEDILSSPVKKWEINCEESLNSIRLKESFYFFNEFAKIRFINSRNKIFVEHDIYSISDEISDYKQENNELKNENSYLKRKLDELKSRRAIKIADKFKF